MIFVYMEFIRSARSPNPDWESRLIPTSVNMSRILAQSSSNFTFGESWIFNFQPNLYSPLGQLVIVSGVLFDDLTTLSAGMSDIQPLCYSDNIGKVNL